MKTVEVAAGVVFRKGELLIAQRLAESHLAGLWEFPGGKREPGETFEQCLTRELLEELGIEVSIKRLLERVTHAYPEKTVQLNFYLCVWRAVEPRALGCADFRWVRAEQLSQYAFPPADQQFLKRLSEDSSLWQG